MTTPDDFYDDGDDSTDSDDSIELIEDRGQHAFIQLPDGSTDIRTWTPRNKLVWKHDLEHLLVTGEDIQFYQGDEWNIDIDPLETDDNTFVMRCYMHPQEIGQEPDYEMTVPIHRKQELLEYLVRIHDDGEPADILVEFVQEELDHDVTPFRVDAVADLPQFDAVTVRDDGWFIHDHLLLSYDNEFYHPEVRATDRSGQVLDDNANRSAYEIEYQNRPETDGQASLGGFEKRASADDELVEFLTRALWAVKQAPESPTL